MNKTKNKWIVSAASAALVASAIVPVASAASFSDIENNDHKDAILALAEAGIISGYPDGTFKPNAEVTRGNVTKLLGKWLVSEGYEIPEDYKTVERFTDLPVDSSDEELVKYAALVKDEGVFKGSNNQLMHLNNMSREQMAVVLVRALNTVYGVDLIADYKAANFESKLTDLDKANADENREAIIALEYAEITKVANGLFNPKNTVTRGQFASFLHRAIENVAPADVKVESVTAVNGTLTVKLAEKGEAVDVKDFKVTQAINGGEAKEVTPSKAELAEDGKTVTLTVDKVAVDATTDQSVVYTVNKVAAEAFVVAATPKVESISAINLKQVEIKFNQELDKDAALDLANYEVSGSHSIAKLQLSEDKKTVTLTLKDALANQTGEVEVKVLKGMKFASGKTLEADYKTEKIKYTDTALPTIDGVTVVGNKQLVIKFSEPIKEGATILSNYTIDGKSFGAFTPKLDAETSRELTIDLTTALTAGEHTFKMADNKVTDLAGLKNNAQDVKLTVESVTTAPTATIVADKTTGQTVTFQFDRKVKAAPQVTFGSEKVTAVLDPKDETGTIYTATFSTKIPNAGGEIKIAKGVEDYFGNKTTEDTVLAFKPVIDAVAPQFVSAELTEAGKIVVKYDEAIQNPTATAKVKLVDKDNKEVKTTVAYNKDAKGNVLDKEISITGTFAPGDYKLSITGVKDKADNVANELKDYTITVADKVAPIVTNVYKQDNAVYVTFDEKVESSSAVSAANYAYIVDGVGNIELPGDAKLTVLAGEKTVKIEFPTKWKVGTSEHTIADVTKLQIKNVLDLAGNKMTQTTQTVGAAADIATVNSNAVTAVTTKKIEVKLSETGVLPADAIGSDFVVKAGDVTLSVAQVEIDSKERKLVLTLAEELTADARYNKAAISVGTVAKPVVTKTADGRDFVFGVDAPITALDKIRAEVKEVKSVVGGISVEFNEDLKDGSIATGVASDIIITDKNGNRVDLTQKDITEVNGFVTIKGLEAGDKYKVAVVPSELKDGADNKVAPYSSTNTVDVVTTATVSTPEDFESAVTDPSVTNVELTKDIVLGKELVVGHNVTIEGNGKKIDGSIKVTAGNPTIKNVTVGNAVVKSTTDDSGITVAENAKATLIDVTVNGQSKGDNNDSAGIIVRGEAVLENVKINTSVTGMNANGIMPIGAAKVTVTGGTIKAESATNNAYGVYVNQEATVNLDGVTFDLKAAADKRAVTVAVQNTDAQTATFSVKNVKSNATYAGQLLHADGNQEVTEDAYTAFAAKFTTGDKLVIKNPAASLKTSGSVIGSTDYYEFTK